MIRRTRRSISCKLQHHLTTAVVLAIATSLGGCGGSESTPTGIPQPPVVTNVEVTSLATPLLVGDSAALVARVTGAGGKVMSGVTITWTSSSASVASVDSRGVVLAIAPGTATIRAAASGRFAETSVTVTEPVAFVAVLPSLGPLQVGETVRLRALSSSASGRFLSGGESSWISSNPAVATIAPDGTLTAHSIGTTTVSASVVDGSGTQVITVGPNGWRSLTVGYAHTCGIYGAGRAYCWGEGGKLGSGTTTEHHVPHPVSGTRSYVSLSAGGIHTCGLTNLGAVYCWSDESPREPVQVPGAFVALSVGGSHACGIAVSGQTQCWGGNHAGQLGNGTTSTSALPKPLAGTRAFVSISAGEAHTCALAADGTAWCWGSNEEGQLGIGSRLNAHLPALVSGGQRFHMLDAGGLITCAATADAGWCWGYNDEGQLGDGTAIRRTVPTQVSGGVQLAMVIPGDFHSCGLSTAGAPYCWGGDNGNNRLGLVTPGTTLVPGPVNTSQPFQSLAVGGSRSCAIAADGRAWCWGVNVYGSIGDGTTVLYRSTPTLVALPSS